MKLLILMTLAVSLFVFQAAALKCKIYTDAEAAEKFEEIFKSTDLWDTEITKDQRKELFMKQKVRINEANKGDPSYCEDFNKFSVMTKKEKQEAGMPDGIEVKTGQ